MNIINMTPTQYTVNGEVFAVSSVAPNETFRYDLDTGELLNIPVSKPDTAYIVEPFLAAMYLRKYGIVRTDFLIPRNINTKTEDLQSDPESYNLPVTALVQYDGVTN